MAQSQLPLILIQIDGKKVGRIKFSDSNSATQLRVALSEKFRLPYSFHFLDADGYPVPSMDEQSTIIGELLQLTEQSNTIYLSSGRNFNSANDLGFRINKQLTAGSESSGSVKNQIKNNVATPEGKSNLLGDERTEATFASPASQSMGFPWLGTTIFGLTSIGITNVVTVATQLDLNTWKQVFANCGLLCAIRMDKAPPDYAVRPVLQFQNYDNLKILVRVKDSSDIRSYMRNRQMQSSFVSSQFFDGDLDFSWSFIGIGINEEYSRRKAKTDEERTMYSTCCFNYPRASLELDLSYLEPTPDFVAAIDDVLRLPSGKQFIELKNVLSKYGHVYPREVVLGGHLYHTEEHRIKGNVEEENMRINAQIRFKASILKPVTVKGTGGNQTKSNKQMLHQDSMTTYQAVGGNTLLSRDTTLWTESVADPNLWRVIEQDNYQLVITLLSEDRQKAIGKILSENLQKKITVPPNDIDITAKAKWTQERIIATEDYKHGNKFNKPDYPQGLYVDDGQTVYITNSGNHHIEVRNCDPMNGQVVAYGKGSGNRSNQLNSPRDVIVEEETDSLIICEWENRSIIPSSTRSSTSEQTIISDIKYEYSPMDDDGFLYVSDNDAYDARQWQVGETSGTEATSGSGQGHRLHQLCCPQYVFIDRDHSMSASNSSNNRVMKRIKAANEDGVVADDKSPGNTLTQLSRPGRIVVDQLATLYKVDHSNNHLMRWPDGATQESINGDENDQAEQANQLNYPIGLPFDQHGNFNTAMSRFPNEEIFESSPVEKQMTKNSEFSESSHHSKFA